ncbi:protein of unknown function (plasmid) [Caballeronia sp. S22]
MTRAGSTPYFALVSRILTSETKKVLRGVIARTHTKRDFMVRAFFRVNVDSLRGHLKNTQDHDKRPDSKHTRHTRQRFSDRILRRSRCRRHAPFVDL